VVLFRLVVEVVTTPQVQALLVKDMQAVRDTTFHPIPRAVVVVPVESQGLPIN
jgi:hypothetical protein